MKAFKLVKLLSLKARYFFSPTVEVVTGFQEQELPLVPQTFFKSDGFPSLISLPVLSLILMVRMLSRGDPSRVLPYKGNPGSQQTLAVDVLQQAKFPFCKIKLQHLPCYLPLRCESSGLAAEKT